MARHAHYEYYVDRTCRLVVVYRTPRPFETLESVAESLDQSLVATVGIDRRTYSLLVDVRDGPSRNDPEFEKTLAEHRGKILRGYAKIATLTTTMVGALHVKRLATSDGLDVFISDDVNQVFNYLNLARHEWPRMPIRPSLF